MSGRLVCPSSVECRVTLWAQSRGLRVPSCRVCCCEEDPLPRGGCVTVTPSRLPVLVSDGDRLPLGLQAARATPTLSAEDEAPIGPTAACDSVEGLAPVSSSETFPGGGRVQGWVCYGDDTALGKWGPCRLQDTKPLLGGLGVPSLGQGHLLSSPSSLSTPFPSAGSAETHSGHPIPALEFGTLPGALEHRGRFLSQLPSPALYGWPSGAQGRDAVRGLGVRLGCGCDGGCWALTPTGSDSC